MRIISFRNFIFVASFLMVVEGCAVGPRYNTLESDIRSGPERVVSEKEGAAEFDRTLVEKGAVSNDPAAVQRLVTMVNKITRVSHRPNAHFTVRLINDKTPNAFSIGGEYLYVHQGLLTFVGSNNDALAGVLAHEVSHDIAGHSSRGLTAQKWQALATELVARTTKNRIATAVTQTAGTLVYLKYTRSQEQEADILGTVYAYRAGYDPRAFIQFFQNLEKQASIPGFMTFASDHPSYDTRVQTIKLVHQYLKKETTIPAIALIDRKVADVLTAVQDLDGVQPRG